MLIIFTLICFWSFALFIFGSFLTDKLSKSYALENNDSVDRFYFCGLISFTFLGVFSNLLNILIPISNLVSLSFFIILLIPLHQNINKLKTYIKSPYGYIFLIVLIYISFQ